MLYIPELNMMVSKMSGPFFVVCLLKSRVTMAKLTYGSFHKGEDPNTNSRVFIVGIPQMGTCFFIVVE